MTDDAGPNGEEQPAEEAKSGPMNKLKQTVVSGIHEMALGKDKLLASVKPSPGDMAHLTPEERSILQKVFQKEEEFEKEAKKMRKPSTASGGSGSDTPSSTPKSSATPVSPPTVLQTCRICRKTLGVDEECHTCGQCGQLVCEDCSSYSKGLDSEGQEWKCSSCRRRQGQDRLGLEPPPGAGMHRVPSVRRMTERMIHKDKAEAEAFLGSLSNTLLNASSRTGSAGNLFLGDDSLLKGPRCDSRRSSEESNMSGRDVGTPTMTPSAEEVAPSISQGERERTRETASSQEGKPQSKWKPSETSGSRRKGSQKERRSHVERHRSAEGVKHRPSNAADTQRGSQYRPASPAECRTFPNEKYPSSETLSDRRSSSESQKGGVNELNKDSSLKGNGPRSPGSLQRSHRKSYSASESSLDEHSHDSDETDRKRRARMRRRSKVQRQKHYVDDADSDPIFYGGEEWTSRSNVTSSVELSSAMESLDNDIDSASRRSSQLHVPPQWNDRPIRHIASDAALYIRRHSSESSDVSDISGEYSTFSDRSLNNSQYEASYIEEAETPVEFKGSMSRRSSARQLLDRDYDPTVTPVTVLESSPSPEYHHHHHSHQRSPRLSVDSEIYPPVSPVQRRSIPSVYVDVVNDQGSRTDFGFEMGEKSPVRRCSTGRALPKIPLAGPESRSLLNLPHGRTRSTHSLDLPPEETGRPERRASAPEGENIRIVVDDVDSRRESFPGLIGQHHPGYRSNTELRTQPPRVPDRPTPTPNTLNLSSRSNRQERLILRRDESDAGARTRGFGLRLMGGKIGEDSRLYTYISWTVPDGPADKMGLKPGDKVIEWDGTTLTNRTYEEVCAIMDKSGDTVELVVEPCSTCPNAEMTTAPAATSQRRRSHVLPTQGEPVVRELDTPTGVPSRRKLPKTPKEMCPSHPQGEVCIQIWYDQERSDLVVTIVSARGLKRREAPANGLPRAYTKVCLLPQASGYSPMKTPIAEPSVNPEWNKTFIFPGVTSEVILDMAIEILVWDHNPLGSNCLLGETLVSLRRADLQDCPEWYALASTTSNTSAPIPHSSTSQSDQGRKPLRWVAGSEGVHSQSLSEDKGDGLIHPDDAKGVTKSSSMDLTLLHPDAAWDRRPEGGPEPERKSSAPNVIYMQTTGNGSRSPSRRNSARLASQDSLPELYGRNTKGSNRARSASFKAERVANSDTEKAESKTRRRASHCVRHKLTRTFSLKSESSKRSVRLGSLAPTNDQKSVSASSPELTPEAEYPEGVQQTGMKQLGVGQIVPKKAVKMGEELDYIGEIKLGFIMTKGQLEVEVVCARGLKTNATGQPPDTYVKTYLKEGDRQMQKKKTRVVRHSTEPQYRQTLKYNAASVLGRTLLVMIWERQKGFEHNQAVGAAEVQLDRLELNKLTVGWYRLYTLVQFNLDSNESN